MSKLNVLVSLNGYADSNPTNNPALNAIRWTRQVSSLEVSEPQDQVLTLAPGLTKSLFSGVVSLSQDGTTAYSLALKSGSSSTYVLKHIAGTAPQFRSPQATLADATTQFSVTKNGNLMVITHAAGTAPSFLVSGVSAGQQVLLGDVFSASNRGVFKILSVTATVLTVENAVSVAETVTLGASFADVFRVFGAAGAQVDDKLTLDSSFSLAAGTYFITHVQDNLIEFYSTATLPVFSSVMDQIEIYTSSKRIVYVESSKEIAVIVNGVEQKIAPAGSNPALLLFSGNVRSLSVRNDTADTSNLYFASVE